MADDFSDYFSGPPPKSAPAKDEFGDYFSGPPPAAGQKSSAPNANPGWWDTAKDVAGSSARNLVKGAVALPMAPRDMMDLAGEGGYYALAKAAEWAGLMPKGKTTADFVKDARALNLPKPNLRTPDSEDLVGTAERTVPWLAEKAKTKPGRYAGTISQMIPGAMLGGENAWQMAKQAMLYGALPGAAVEATHDLAPRAPGWAAPAMGVAATAIPMVAGHVMGGTTAAAHRMVTRAAGDMTQAELNAAEKLFADAQSMGVPLTRAEASDAVTKGATSLGDLLRVVEGQGGLRRFFGKRPDQIKTAGRSMLDQIQTPANMNPSSIGQEVQQAARSVVEESPEGQKLAGDVWRAGPRVTAEEAGSMMQPELRNTYDKREGMRAALGEQDYDAARNVPATIPLDGGRLGQIDPSAAARSMEDAAAYAKGPTRSALNRARETLNRPEGELDYSVRGLHNARTALTDVISEQKIAGANNAARELQGALGTLDNALDTVPEYKAARQNFEAASRPLEPFEETPLGKIIERDQFEKRFTMPAEQVPGAVEKGGASMAQNFADVAPGPARDAYANHIVTKILDQAGRDGLDIKSQPIRDYLLANEDALRRFPEIRQRLEVVADSREALEKLRVGPIGKLIDTPETNQAVNVLFGNPTANSEREVFGAVKAIAGKNPAAAKDVVRQYLETQFNTSTKRFSSTGNEFGGAKFAADIMGNPQDAANIKAAISALPGGHKLLPGFERFMDVLEATGHRQRVGSRTSFNTQLLSEMKTAGPMRTVAAAAPSAWTKLPGRIMEKYDEWALGKNVGELARLLTDPAAGPAFRSLATAPGDSARFMGALARLAFIADQAPQQQRRDVRGRLDFAPQRASGGRVGSTAAHLDKEASRGLKALGGATTPLMHLPDEQIAQALRIAKHH